jgi:hypothetical protein
LKKKYIDVMKKNKTRTVRLIERELTAKPKMGIINSKQIRTSAWEEFKSRVDVIHRLFSAPLIRISFDNVDRVNMFLHDKYIEVSDWSISNQANILDKIIAFAKKQNIPRVFFRYSYLMYTTNIYSPYYGDYYVLNMFVLETLKEQTPLAKRVMCSTTEHNQMLLSLPMSQLIDIFTRKYYSNPFVTCCKDLTKPFRKKMHDFVMEHYDFEKNKSTSSSDILDVVTVGEFFQLFDKHYIPIIRDACIKKIDIDDDEYYSLREIETIDFMYDICELVNSIPLMRYIDDKGSETSTPLLIMEESFDLKVD